MKYYPRNRKASVSNIPRLLTWLPVFIWMGVIFWLSSQSGFASSSLSSGITQSLWIFLNQLFSVSMDMHIFHVAIRKLAHFGSYCILGVLCTQAIILSFVIVRKERVEVLSYLYPFAASFFLCVLYAITDEIHQLFVPGRSGEISDVLIDGSGALFGCLLYCLVNFVVLSNSRKRKTV